MAPRPHLRSEARASTAEVVMAAVIRCNPVGRAGRECVTYDRDGGQHAICTGERRRSDGTRKRLHDHSGSRPRRGEIDLVTGGDQDGPCHANDEILVPGTPRFGRRPSDDTMPTDASMPLRVDGVACAGDDPGPTVQGAIARAHHGAAGTGGASTGSANDLPFDDRLRPRTPPTSPGPVGSSWRLHSQVEQVPAT